MTTHHVIGGPNDGFTRLSAGLCPFYPCSGRMMMRNMETKVVPFPDWKWLKEECIKRGNVTPTPETIEITTYTYKCLECGQESFSTEPLQSAVMN